MAAPTNQTALTAIDLGTLPASISQNVHDAGTTYTVWYKYTATQSEWVIGLFGFGDLATYTPTTNVYIGPASAPVGYPASGQIIAVNKAINVSVEGGTTYFFEFVTNGGNPNPAVLLIEAETAPCDGSVPSGSILVPSDTTDMPVALINSVDGSDEVLGYLARDESGSNLPSAEQGDSSKDGFFMIENGSNNNSIKMYNPDGTYFQTITFPSVGSLVIRQKKVVVTWDWAVAWKGSGPDAAEFTLVSRDLTIARSSTVTLPLAGLTAVAVSNNERLVYYSGQGGSLNSEINVWDRNVNAEIADLVADFGGTFKVLDILVLSDDSLVVSYIDAGSQTTVKHYDSSGSTLNTFDLGTSFTGTNPRMTNDKNATDTSFWIMLHASGLTTFRQIRLSDGVVISEIEAVEYTGGAYAGAATATPTRFGVSPSCPLILTGPVVMAACPLNPNSGLLKIVPDKTDDTYWVDPIAETETSVKIPDPTGKSGLIGQ